MPRAQELWAPRVLPPDKYSLIPGITGQGPVWDPPLRWTPSQSDGDSTLSCQRPLLLESEEETENPLGCFVYFALTLLSLASVPNPFTAKRSIRSLHLIIL